MDQIQLHLYWNLLIVPYGIETPYTVFLSIAIPLLIVPYGIETAYEVRSPAAHWCF